VIAITVNPVNDAPVAVDDAYAVDEDTPLTIAAAAGVLANDSDAEADPLTAVLVDDVANGVLTLNPDGSVTVPPGSTNGGGQAGGFNPGFGSATVMSLNEHVKLGFSVGALAAAGVDYESNWVGRTFVTENQAIVAALAMTCRCFPMSMADTTRPQKMLLATRWMLVEMITNT